MKREADREKEREVDRDTGTQTEIRDTELSEEIQRQAGKGR